MNLSISKPNSFKIVKMYSVTNNKEENIIFEALLINK